MTRMYRYLNGVWISKEVPKDMEEKEKLQAALKLLNYIKQKLHL